MLQMWLAEFPLVESLQDVKRKEHASKPAAHGCADYQCGLIVPSTDSPFRHHHYYEQVGWMTKNISLSELLFIFPYLL